jgi:hypothetical protein
MPRVVCLVVGLVDLVLVAEEVVVLLESMKILSIGIELPSVVDIISMSSDWHGHLMIVIWLVAVWIA